MTLLDWLILVGWGCGALWVVLFFMGASAIHSDAETYGDLDAESGPLAEVIRFPRERSGCLDVTVPEYKPIIDGTERGWC